ncbi:purine nucleoside permease [Grosmannia clavigera kw1407]|uniref:Purine nucleoside permease n=1 Tax=Grosmannia clavigera (strain kw1407 / UAMH 11150) TaxID=655863 RepID=F0XCH1_GROCL|nr:purine nucleoside permease [Grosmannia clavigera kw1407]EFX03883.1 purine nucleoside permease [Grosmannia clavigera kw1407]
MRFSSVATALLATAQYVAAAPSFPAIDNKHNGKIAPKVMIVSLFHPEAAIWYSNLPSSGLGNLMDVNITAPGLSMLFPHVHCVADHSICQMTTGESEINAASTVMAAVLSGKFDLTETYFMIAGIGGVNPKYSTLGGVALARYSVQVALQYEFDAREMPANWSTGYFGYGTEEPDVYPGNQYGTEVLEVSETLRDIAFGYASKANLTDDPIAAEYRARYAAAADGIYTAGTAVPSVVKCDTATSDVYYSGTILGEAFENVTKVWTNGTGEYCMTAQEDSAVLEVLVRLAIEGMVDFKRVILMRTGSDFDRPPPGITAFANLVTVDQNGFEIAIKNIYNAGIEIVKGILKNWDCTFKEGVTPTNYVGDIFGSLGGEPDFGPGSLTGGIGYLPGGRSGDLTKRSTKLTRRTATTKRAKRGIVVSVRPSKEQ